MSEEKNDLNLPDPEKHWCPKCKRHSVCDDSSSSTDHCSICDREVFSPNGSIEEKKMMELIGLYNKTTRKFNFQRFQINLDPEILT